ncbi:MAG: hypothetical protein ACYCZW_02120 [Minisyncoccota bacterium]
MKVKTFISGIANGLAQTYEFLDNQVNELNPTEIIFINDTHLADGILSDKINYYTGPCIVRMVVYK